MSIEELYKTAQCDETIDWQFTPPTSPKSPKHRQKKTSEPKNNSESQNKKQNKKWSVSKDDFDMDMIMCFLSLQSESFIVEYIK